MNLNIAIDHVSQDSLAIGYPNPHEHDAEGSLIFRFTRREVATVDFRRLCGLIRPEKLESNVLRSLRGSLVIQLPATSARHEEPFLCETTRHFCQAFRDAFPAWAFFFSLENLALWKMSVALVDHSKIVQFERAWQTRIMLAPDCVKQVIADHLEQTKAMATRAEMSVLETDNVLKAVRDYFTKVTGAYCRA